MNKGPGFYVASNVHALEAADATFVDNIHTDAPFFGAACPSGHVDFWPNFPSRQPGCPDRENSPGQSTGKVEAVTTILEKHIKIKLTVRDMCVGILSHFRFMQSYACVATVGGKCIAPRDTILRCFDQKLVVIQEERFELE